MVFLALLGICASLLEAVIGARAHRKDQPMLAWGLYLSAFVIFLASGAALYDSSRTWEIGKDQEKSLIDSACNTREKFPFLVFDLPGYPDSNLPARQIATIFGEQCKWTGVRFWPQDGWLPAENTGVYVVYGDKERMNPVVQQQVRNLSIALRRAGIDHNLTSHTRLDTLQVKVGIVFGKKPNLWEHLFGYGEY